MKTLLKVLGVTLSILVVGASGLLAYVNSAFPKVSPAPDLRIEPTQARLKRGEYLVNTTVGCLGCHSQRAQDKLNFPVRKDVLGAGGFVMDKRIMGLPGTLVTRNITPHNLKDWTDGELVRALRVGVNKKGQALFPLMPYQHYRELSQEDLYSVVAYIRSIKSIASDPAPTKLDFPVNFIVKTVPKDAGAFPADPDRKDKVAYGRYLVNAASCTECHTPRDGQGKPLPGLDLAGGNEFHLADGSTSRSVNITPDKATGIGDWSKDYFIQRFRKGRQMVLSGAKVGPGDFNSFMPWEEYGGMTDEDLGAIHEYLQKGVKPVKNQVEKFTPKKP